jgi:hypothetical protein
MSKFGNAVKPGHRKYQPGARDSLKHLFGDKTPLLNLVDSATEQNVNSRHTSEADAGSNQLIFPTTLGTDKHTHLIVFHVYTGIEANPFGENSGINQQTVTDSQIGRAKEVQSGTIGGIVGAGTGYAVSRFGLSKVKGFNWGKFGLFRDAILTGAGAYGGYKAGEGMADLTDAEQEAIGKIEEYERKQQIAFAEENARVFKATGRTARLGEAKYRNKDVIAMYMPQKIQSLSLVEYEQQDLSFVQNIMNSWTGLVAGGILKKAPGVVDSLLGFAGMNSNIDTAIQAKARIAPNPRKQLLFREPVSRKFEFAFNLSPRNEEESVLAYSIIQTFKKHAYPTLNRKVGHGAFYTFPAEFEIQYQTLDDKGELVENDWINRIGRCALREINVDYAASGSFTTFKNGAPTNMLMTLTFEEMTLLDSHLVEEGY